MMDHQLGDQSTSVDVIQKPWKNLFWREYQRAVALQNSLNQLVADSNQFKTTVLNTEGQTSLLVALQGIKTTLDSIVTLLQTIDNRLHAHNGGGFDGTVAKWCADIRDSTRGVAFPVGVPTAFDRLTDIRAQTQKLTFTGPDLNVV